MSLRHVDQPYSNDVHIRIAAAQDASQDASHDASQDANQPPAQRMAERADVGERIRFGAAPKNRRASPRRLSAPRRRSPAGSPRNGAAEAAPAAADTDSAGASAAAASDAPSEAAAAAAKAPAIKTEVVDASASQRPVVVRFQIDRDRPRRKEKRPAEDDDGSVARGTYAIVSDSSDDASAGGTDAESHEPRRGGPVARYREKAVPSPGTAAAISAAVATAFHKQRSRQQPGQRQRRGVLRLGPAAPAGAAAAAAVPSASAEAGSNAPRMPMFQQQQRLQRMLLQQPPSQPPTLQQNPMQIPQLQGLAQGYARPGGVSAQQWLLLRPQLQTNLQAPFGSGGSNNEGGIQSAVSTPAAARLLNLRSARGLQSSAEDGHGRSGFAINVEVPQQPQEAYAQAPVGARPQHWAAAGPAAAAFPAPPLPAAPVPPPPAPRNARGGFFNRVPPAINSNPSTVTDQRRPVLQIEAAYAAPPGVAPSMLPGTSSPPPSPTVARSRSFAAGNAVSPIAPIPLGMTAGGSFKAVGGGGGAGLHRGGMQPLAYAKAGPFRAQDRHPIRATAAIADTAVPANAMTRLQFFK
jgi:hypothetical protein